MNYSEYRRKKAKRRTYSYWRNVEEAIMIILGIIAMFAFMLAPLVYQIVMEGGW